MIKKKNKHVFLGNVKMTQRNFSVLNFFIIVLFSLNYPLPPFSVVTTCSRGHKPQQIEMKTQVETMATQFGYVVFHGV